MLTIDVSASLRGRFARAHGMRTMTSVAAANEALTALALL